LSFRNKISRIRIPGSGPLFRKLRPKTPLVRNFFDPTPTPGGGACYRKGGPLRAELCGIDPYGTWHSFGTKSVGSTGIETENPDGLRTTKLGSFSHQNTIFPPAAGLLQPYSSNFRPPAAGLLQPLFLKLSPKKSLFPKLSEGSPTPGRGWLSIKADLCAQNFGDQTPMVR